jgi:ribonuclease VapC
VRALVLDSWAMMAFFENEASGERVEELLLQAHRSGAALFMSAVNAGELWYSTTRVHSAKEADMIVEELRNLRIEVVAADWETARQAAAYKAKGRIAYADCFAAALAKLRGASVVTGDPEFKVLARDIPVVWI